MQCNLNDMGELINIIKSEKIKKIIYKCIFNRHEEKFRISTNQTTFCNATLEYIYRN